MDNRLTTKADFSRVMDGGAKAVSAGFFLLLAKHNHHASARLGMVVSKKAYRKAVQRNRLKRLIRESFRHRQDAMPSIDVVVLARKGQVLVDNSQVFKELDHLWSDVCAKFAPRSCG